MTDNASTNRIEEFEANPPSITESATAFADAVRTAWTDSNQGSRPQSTEPTQLVFNNPFTAQEGPAPGQPPRPPEQQQTGNGSEGNRPADRPPGAAPQERPAPLTAEQINDLIHGDHGLNSNRYAERAQAQIAIERAGVTALPALMGALRANDMPLEARRRCEQAVDRLVSRNFNDLLAGVRSPDAAVSQASELLLSRQRTDDLLRNSTHHQLTPENRTQFNNMIRTRLNDQQLEALANSGSGKGFDLQPNENSLRLAVAASQVLGRPNQSANYQLGAILMQSHLESDRTQGEAFLRNSLTGGESPSMSGAAQRLLASRAFDRGDNAAGVALAGDAIRNLGAAARASFKDPLVRQELGELAALTQRAVQNGQNLTDGQRSSLREIGTQSSQERADMDRALQEHLQQMNNLGINKLKFQ